jgi:uncharacterized integral membrane protein
VIVAYVLMALVGAAVAVFAVQNLDPVVIAFLGWRVQGMPLALVILGSLVSGMILAWAAAMVPYLRLRARLRQCERSLAQGSRGPLPGRAESGAPARPEGGA